MKRKRTAAEKRARRERKKKYRIIFINGKQKRVPREPMIGGLPVDEFIRRNADPIWLHQNEMWELIPVLDHNGLPIEEFIGPDDDPMDRHQYEEPEFTPRSEDECDRLMEPRRYEQPELMPQCEDDWEIPF